MLTLRDAGGLGDAFYMYPVLKYFLEQGEKVEILTKYPDVYTPLIKKGLIITPRHDKQPTVECRYAPRYPIQTTTTYQDTLILAGITEKLPFEFEFESEHEFDFKTDKKICVIRKPTMPMRGKALGELLIPDCTILQRIIDKFKNEIFFILAGNAEGDKFNFPLKGIDVDLTQKLTLPDLFQLVNQSDLTLTQCGFFIPLCETLNKKCFILFADKGMKSRYKFFPHITPKKVINKYEIVGYAIDNEPFDTIADKFEELLRRTQ
jgi:hypothetical protein